MITITVTNEEATCLFKHLRKPNELTDLPNALVCIRERLALSIGENPNELKYRRTTLTPLPGQTSLASFSGFDPWMEAER